MEKGLNLAERFVMQYWQLSVEDVLKALKSDFYKGLSEEEAQKRLSEIGYNLLKEEKIKSPLTILKEQLSGILVIILIIAAVVSAFLGEYADAIVIGIIVVLNALLGVGQEYRAEKAMAALKKLSVPVVKVRRDGEIKEIPASHLVPGDVVLLETGNIVPADCRLIECFNLKIQEAALTGESEAVLKNTEPIKNEKSGLGDRTNMAYMGTIITYGRAVALVVETGMRTELGKIAGMLQDVKREATPLQVKLEEIGKGLAIAALCIVAVIFVEGLVTGGLGIENIKLMFMTAISMAVAAVPEGLPAVVTIALALGAQRMLKRNALIRKLLAVETLGCVTVICSDKTGTLTENKMTVTILDVVGHRLNFYEYISKNNTISGNDVGMDLPGELGGFSALLVAGALCNDAVIQLKENKPVASGDPTEAAMAMAAQLTGINKAKLEEIFPRVDEIPFDSDRKRMTTIHRIANEVECGKFLGFASDLSSIGHIAFCKGAPDSILTLSDYVLIDGVKQRMTEELRKKIASSNESMASQGIRVLAVAYREFSDKPQDKTDLEQRLVFLGLVGMMDPPRAEVKDAVKRCKEAGIRPVMITGDHPLTALSIAKELGFDGDGGILTGIELSQLSDDELKEKVKNVSVYARVAPEHKLKIVNALQAHGEVVAMTGDGVNDAPALRKANIGVAMGITGTDVSKEAADMVLRDDNFATIVAAVEEGRVIYDNIRKFVKYLLSTNSGELWLMFFAPLLGLPLPLLPIQILWMNLITDGIPALALGVEPAEKDIMKRPPRKTTENIFSGGLGFHIVWVGLLMAVICILTAFVYKWLGLFSFSSADGVAYYRTMLFTIVYCLQLGHAMAIRSHKESLFTQGVFSNKYLIFAVLATVAMQIALIYVPFLQKFFKTVPLSITDLVIAIILSTGVFWAVELEKFFKRLRYAKT